MQHRQVVTERAGRDQTVHPRSHGETRPAGPAVEVDRGFGDTAAQRILDDGQRPHRVARDPEILFLDEPTASLDPAATKAVEDIVRLTAQSGVKVVMATHDLGQARRLAGDVVFLVRGRLAEQAPAEEFFNNPATAQAAAFQRGDLVI